MARWWRFSGAPLEPDRRGRGVMAVERNGFFTARPFRAAVGSPIGS